MKLSVSVTEALGVFVVPSLAYAFAFWRNNGKSIVAIAFVINCLLLASAFFYGSLVNYLFSQNQYSFLNPSVAFQSAGSNADQLQSALLIAVLFFACVGVVISRIRT
jgi:hypothetical protein